MRGLRVVMCLLAVTVACAAEVSPAKRDLIVEVMELGRLYELGASELVQSMVLGAALAGVPPDEAAIARGVEMTLRDDESRRMIEESYIPLFDPFSESELRELVRFYSSPAGKRLSEVHLLVLTTGRSRLMDQQIHGLEGAMEESKELRTKADMRSIATAAEAYAIDANTYPTGNSVEDLRDELEPLYIRNLPTLDGWGNRYAWVADSSSLRIISGGPDGIIEPANLEMGAARHGDDIVYQDYEFLE